MKKRIAVTGASGFIGRHIVEDLILNGFEVVAIGRNIESLQKIKVDCKRHATDYTEVDLGDAFSGCDTVIHFAGRRTTRADDPSLSLPFIESAISLLDGLLPAAKSAGVRRIITASSIAVYSAHNTSPYAEAELPKPVSPYGLAKWVSELACDMWARETGSSVAHMRLAACYGYGEKDTPALMNFVSKAISGMPIVLTNGGRYPIDEIYIRDVIRATRMLIDSSFVGPVNIGSDRGASIAEIASAVKKTFNSEMNIKILPVEETSITQIQRHMDISRARLELGWQPEFSLEAGLASLKQAWIDAQNEEKDKHEDS